ncbi:hypothetical protein EDB80DRAFT_809426 [Ilyonectria destructans]|nr:hypothetical protein EDB80DRAFT_809426 [Ilyonectria destructans]
MEETDVIIVGGGPSGLALALALNHQNINSIILEKELEISEDPRAIALAGDVHRLVELLGVNHAKMKEIGQNLTDIHFHRKSFTSKPFLSIDQDRDWGAQALPPASVILQPRLEKEFRALIEASKCAELRLECTVTGINEVETGVQATYKRKDGSTAELKASYLVGADGKRGIVRKEYLEDKGIEQVTGLYKYEATWIAANVRINLPTPATHPSFPLWKIGYQPDELWDIFWPGGWHFCNHPTMPIATGRFGPKDGKYWRFEYELPPNYVPDDLEKHLEEQLMPHLVLPASRFSRKGMAVKSPVQFPWDCIEVLRCAPANFTQKVVNKWFHNNIILIGDAAHVFPPFGAQGIANGVQDAFALSWRLALLCNQKARKQLVLNQESLLDCWSRERRKGVDDASTTTSENGNILLSKSPAFITMINMVSSILEFVPSLRNSFIRNRLFGSTGFLGVDGGFFLENQGGGLKAAQVCFKAADGSVYLSDHAFWKSTAILTLLVLQHPTEQEASDIKIALRDANLPPYILSDEIIELCKDEPSNCDLKSALSTTKLMPGTAEHLAGAGLHLLPFYDPAAFKGRFQAKAHYALIRPDSIIFSQAQTPAQLLEQLRQVSDRLENN